MSNPQDQLLPVATWKRSCCRRWIGGRLNLAIASLVFAALPFVASMAAEGGATTNSLPRPAASNALERAAVVSPSDAVYDDVAVFTEALLLVKRQYAEEKEFRNLIYGAIDGMLVSLDPHSGFLAPDEFQELQEDTSGHFAGIGIHVGIKEGRLIILAPVDGSPAQRAGLQAGDVVVKIDQQSSLGISMDDAVRRLRGSKGSSVVLTVEREGQDPFNVTIVREDVKILSVRGVRILRNGVGYIRMTQFSEETGTEFDQALQKLLGQKMTALVVDLRDNPGGLLTTAVEVTGMLLPKGADIVSVRGRVGVRKEERYRADGGRHLTGIPVAVLVNGHSASAAEIMAGALQDSHRAVVVGDTTFGKASVQTVVRLSTRPECALRLTTAHYYTPAGRMIHGKGIVPDIQLPTSPMKWRSIVLKRVYDEMPESFPASLREKVEDVQDEPLARAVDIVVGARILRPKD